MKENALGQKTFSINRETDHSFEFVANINDVTYINDSKATNAKQTANLIVFIKLSLSFKKMSKSFSNMIAATKQP